MGKAKTRMLEISAKEALMLIKRQSNNRGRESVEVMESVSLSAIASYAYI
jgi:hypothetical protein